MNKRNHGAGNKEQCLHFLQCLTECGWNPEEPADKEGNTALSVACRGAGHESGVWAIRYLVENGADVNAANMQGQTPAMNLYGGCFWNGHIPPVLRLFHGLIHTADVSARKMMWRFLNSCLKPERI